MTTQEFQRFEQAGLDIQYREPLPVKRFPLAYLVQTCEACPSQWEGITQAGQPVYIRYRYGCLRLDIDDHTVLTWTRPDAELEDNYYDGHFPFSALHTLTNSFLDYTTLL